MLHLVFVDKTNIQKFFLMYEFQFHLVHIFLQPYLKSHKEIKIAYEKRDNLFEDEKIHEILTISRFIYEIANNKKSTTQILEILSYSFFELPMLEIIKIVGQARSDRKAVFDYLSDAEDIKIRATAEFFAELVATSLTEPLDIFLSKLVKKNANR